MQLDCSYQGNCSKAATHLKQQWKLLHQEGPQPCMTEDLSGLVGIVYVTLRAALQDCRQRTLGQQVDERGKIEVFLDVTAGTGEL